MFFCHLFQGELVKGKGITSFFFFFFHVFISFTSWIVPKAMTFFKEFSWRIFEL